MATLDQLKIALQQKTAEVTRSATEPLSDSQYAAGFEIVGQETAYQDFIVPQLSQLIASLFDSRVTISVLEIGPGPKSVLGYLPAYIREKIEKYVALEPNELFATKLEDSLHHTAENGLHLSGIKEPAKVYRAPFNPECAKPLDPTENVSEEFDLVLFCHSMYGMDRKPECIRKAVEMLSNDKEGSIVVIFQRGDTFHYDGLVSHQTACFPNGALRVLDKDEVLDTFASFIPGFVTEDVEEDTTVKAQWREVCRALGQRDESHPDQMLFSVPNIMATFNAHATALFELTSQVPVAVGDRKVKNREASVHHAAAVIQPSQVSHVQQAVQWAVKHGLNLTVIGGGHGGHCVRPDVVAIDISAFNQIDIVPRPEDASSRVVVGAGCRSGDVIRETKHLTLPVGGRPSVGAGLWLQGGIGHLARLRGLACDSIVGAVMVSVATGELLCVGDVPAQLQPPDAKQTDNPDLLWAIRGAGTNFGIVISIILKPYEGPSTFSLWSWNLTMSDHAQAKLKLNALDKIAQRASPRWSTDVYLYSDADRLRLGVTIFDVRPNDFDLSIHEAVAARTILGLEDDSKEVDAVGLFETEMYMSQMHGGHAGGKTSAFKRCMFLKHIGEKDISDLLISAVDTRPSPLCYLHLLQGGGAIRDIASEASAFGCREWDFACVITGVWPRDQDGSEIARAAIKWVYDVAHRLLPLSHGAYSADLGPDPRDAALAEKAFGPNLSRLAHLKASLDPNNVLAYACPLPKVPCKLKLVILITGGICAGKDYCADIWASYLNAHSHQKLYAKAVSISDAIKREYAEVTGADVERLHTDCAYKEHHRPALTEFYQAQVRQRPKLPEEHVLNLVHAAKDVDVLLISGIRDQASVAAFFHLAPCSKWIEVEVCARNNTRMDRLHVASNGFAFMDGHRTDTKDWNPDLVFHNDNTGSKAVGVFCKDHLLPFLRPEMQRLSDMVHVTPNFPHAGIDFRDVLGITRQTGGLDLCTSLLQDGFLGDWANVDVIVCCETGGFVFASSLAMRVDVPLVLIREAGKLPPPTISVAKPASYISSGTSRDTGQTRIEIGRQAIQKGSSVVVVDDVLASGKTTCAILQLLTEAGIRSEDVTVLAVAEFAVHRARQLVRRRGFGKTRIQSLLPFKGA